MKGQIQSGNEAGQDQQQAQSQPSIQKKESTQVIQNKLASAIHSPQSELPPIQTKQSNSAPIQTKQSGLSPYQSPAGQKPPIQAKQRPVQRNTDNSKSSGNVNEAQVKANVSNIMGVDVTQAKVNYNSSKPAQLKAEAYAQGNTVEIAPGKEKHLGHELAHIGQQAQGRVQPTIQGNNGIGINNDPKLEKEADDIGDQAMSMQPTQMKQSSSRKSSTGNIQKGAPLQGKFEGKVLALSKMQLQEEIAKHYEAPFLDQLDQLEESETVYSNIHQIALALDLEPMDMGYELTNLEDLDKDDGLQTELTPQGVQQVFIQHMRRGVNKFAKEVGLNKKMPLYTEALKFAKINYDNVLSTLDDPESYPSADEITDFDYIDRKFKELRDNVNKVSKPGFKMHLRDYLRNQDIVNKKKAKLFNGNKSAMSFMFEYSRKARSKNAGVWATAAREIARLNHIVDEYLHPSQQQEIENQMSAKRGRNLRGRLAYHLMNVPQDEISNRMVGNDPKDGITSGKIRGMGKLALDLTDAFDNAACHNNAQQMLDFMSHKKSYWGQQEVTDRQISQETSRKILAQIKTTPGKRKVLKLTNYSNHSILYLIGENKLTQYETVAQPDSQVIMYNDLIRNSITESSLDQSLKSGVDSIANVGKEKDHLLQWEVHQATDLETFRKNIKGTLQNSSTALGISNSIAAHEALEAVNVRGGDTYGLDINNYKTLKIPLETINTTQANLYEYGEKGKVNPQDLVPDTTYRMQAQNRWMSVTYRGNVQAQNVPDWMNPCGKFEINSIKAGYSEPQMRPMEQGERQTTMWNFVFQVSKKPDSRKTILTPDKEDYQKEWGNFIITHDPKWNSGNKQRKIYFKEKEQE